MRTPASSSPFCAAPTSASEDQRTDQTEISEGEFSEGRTCKVDLTDQIVDLGGKASTRKQVRERVNAVDDLRNVLPVIQVDRLEAKDLRNERSAQRRGTGRAECLDRAYFGKACFVEELEEDVDVDGVPEMPYRILRAIAPSAFSSLPGRSAKLYIVDRPLTSRTAQASGEMSQRITVPESLLKVVDQVAPERDRGVGSRRDVRFEPAPRSARREVCKSVSSDV